MFVATLRLVNYRSYSDATVAFGPALNVVVGANATGKTNLLEGAWFALRGSSPRTGREDKLVTWGERFARVEVELRGAAAGPQALDIILAPGQGKRVRWNGVQVASVDDSKERNQAFIFVPESLLLVKGSPARRRTHLDVFAAALDPAYAAAARAAQEALRQRNAQLLSVKQGGERTAIDVWDEQFARSAVALGRRRRALVEELAPLFAAAATTLTPEGGGFALELVSQLEDVAYGEAALVEELRRLRPAEIRRGLCLFGPHRDDIRFLELGGERRAVDSGESDGLTREGAAVTAAAGSSARGALEMPAGGRDLRLFGSQGEQRAAVLALLLAEQELAAARTGEWGMLFLDDVMSELDDTRRRLLVARLASRGQAIITTTNRHYFTENELADARVIELPLDGSAAEGPAPPEMGAL